MSKRMFLPPVEVEDVLGWDGWVRPKEGDFDDDELIHKSRVIYADEMKTDIVGGSKAFFFHGVSSTPEKDEWEKWGNDCPLAYDAVERKELADWFRRMPKGKP